MDSVPMDEEVESLNEASQSVNNMANDRIEAISVNVSPPDLIVETISPITNDVSESVIQEVGDSINEVFSSLNVSIYEVVSEINNELSQLEQHQQHVQQQEQSYERQQDQQLDQQQVEQQSANINVNHSYPLVLVRRLSLNDEEPGISESVDRHGGEIEISASDDVLTVDSILSANSTLSDNSEERIQGGYETDDNAEWTNGGEISVLRDIPRIDNRNHTNNYELNSPLWTYNYLEPMHADTVRFDRNLPAEHSYMGVNMNRVSGVNYLDTEQEHNIMLFMHDHVLFPGEILPFMISGFIIDGVDDDQNGLLFGICFPFLNDNTNSDNWYGVTCQIYEKGIDERGNTLIKSRALQRFIIKSNDIIGTMEYINDRPQMKCFGKVRILPDIYLPEPLKCIYMGSMNRFRDSASMSHEYKRFQVASTPLPLHVYEYYSISSIIEKARTKLVQHNIDAMPVDHTQLSYWLVRNLHLSEMVMQSIFMTNSVNARYRLIADTFEEEAVFCCRYCSSDIANCCSLFAMSKHGVQTQYCNSAGYIHETNTVYQVKRQAIIHSGSPSTEFSWFPGYQWHVIICKVCRHHLGWEYNASEPNLVPKTFYGITSSSVRIRRAQWMRNAGMQSIIQFMDAMPQEESNDSRRNIVDIIVSGSVDNTTNNDNNANDVE